MVTDALIRVWSGFVTWAVGLLGTADPPPYISTIADFMANIFRSVQGLGVWVPWAFILVIASANLALWAVVLGIKALRWVIGLLPTMGGG